MKKTLLTVMIAALLVTSLGGVALAQTPEASGPEAAAREQDFGPGCVPAETDVLESMTPAVHAVVLAMLHQGRDRFSPQDSELVWESLYNMLSLYGQMDERSSYVDGDLILPAETLRDFSSALTSGEHDLGAPPDALSDRMVYTSEIDSYRLACGDDSLAQIRLASSGSPEYGLDLTGALVYLVDGTDLASFQVTLRPCDNLFGYAITALELL